MCNYMTCAGRPRQRSEVEELRASRKADCKELVEKISKVRGRPTRFDYGLEAATILHTLEETQLPAVLKAECQDRVQLLRRTRTGAAIDAYGRMRDADFLEAFIAKCAPGWDWRKKTLTRDQTEERAARDERYIQKLARTQRESRAHANRDVLPEGPNPSWLIFLANRIRPNDKTTWATLKELKLATGLSERTTRQIIYRHRPKKSELVAKTPRRFAPRLVLCVADEFLKRLPELEIDEKQRRDCIEAARQVRQSLAIAA